jgi:hypothetical protein
MHRVGAQVGFGSRGALVGLTGYLGSGWVKPLAYPSLDRIMKKAIGYGMMVSGHCLGRCRMKWV